MVTFEFENVPPATAEAAAAHAPVRPAGPAAAHDASTVVREKAALRGPGVPVAGSPMVDDADDLAAASRKSCTPGMLKTAAWGYDGKGQLRIDHPDAGAGGLGGLGAQPA